MWSIAEDQKNQITQYLLGQLDEADEEKIELRLLSDADFSAEFDIIVDEIAIRYVSGGFEGEEKDRVERYFLRTRERQDKAKVMSELLHHTASRRGDGPVPDKVVDKGHAESGSLASGWSFWNKLLLPRFALSAIALVVVASLAFWVFQRGPATSNFATLTLSATNAERGEPGEEIKSVRLSPNNDGLRIQLLLPTHETRARAYRVEFVPSSAGQNATVVPQDVQTVVVTVPAVNLRRDRYAIRVFAVYEDGQEKRIPGSYIFRVE